MLEPTPYELLAEVFVVEDYCVLIDGWAGEKAWVLGINPTEIREFNGYDDVQSIAHNLKELAMTYGDDMVGRERGFWGGAVALLAYPDVKCKTMSQKHKISIKPAIHLAQYPVVARFVKGKWDIVGATKNFPVLTQKLEHYINKLRKQKKMKSLGNAEKESFTRTKLLVQAEEYQAWVQNAIAKIKAGELWQVNLAHPIYVQGNENLANLYKRVATHSPSPWGAFYSTPDFAVLSNSPEILLGSEGSKIWTKPIAGTRPRHTDSVQDKLLKQSLEKSYKDRAEHLMTVDLLRNDMGKISQAGSIELKLLAAVEEYQNVFHIVSVLRAELTKDKTQLDALNAVLIVC